MKKFCYDYLNMDASNLEFLVGGIIDTALADDSFNGMLFVGDKWITKDLLEQETEYNLQAFLLSVWHHIVTDYNNAGDALGAYEAWTDQANPLTIKTTIGDRFVDKIHVNTDDVKFIRPNTKSLKIRSLKNTLSEKSDSEYTANAINTDQKSIQIVSDAENIGHTAISTHVPQVPQALHVINIAHIGNTSTDGINNTQFDNMVSDDSDSINFKVIKPVSDNDSLKFDMSKRYLLDDCDIQDYTKQMKPSPGRLMILSLYFITLEYNSEYYVVLDYTSYVQSDYSDGYAVNNGMWTVPHTSIFVDTGRIKPTTIKEVKDEYDKFMSQNINQDRMAKAQEDLLYSLGILNGEAHTPYKGREYIEYKESHTITKEMRCFYIREFFIHGINKAGVTNLIDPEGLHQHYIAPLALIRSTKAINGVYHFKGRVIPHNLSDVFIDAQNLAHVLSCVNKVQVAARFTKVKGILFIMVISDAAGVYREIKDKYVAGLAEQIVPSIFEKCMIDFNVRYYSADKSQVIGILPKDNLDFTNMLEKLFEEITDTLAENGAPIALRCTVLSCECLHGKIIGICDPKPGFIGESFDKLCHMVDETCHVHWHTEEVFNGILLSWDEKDDISFNVAEARLAHTDRLNDDSRTMKFKILDRKDYVEEKQKRYKITSNNSFRNRIIRRIPKVR